MSSEPPLRCVRRASEVVKLAVSDVKSEDHKNDQCGVGRMAYAVGILPRGSRFSIKVIAEWLGPREWSNGHKDRDGRINRAPIPTLLDPFCAGFSGPFLVLLSPRLVFRPSWRRV